MEQAHDEADDGATDTDDHIARALALAKAFDDQGGNDAGDGVAKAGAGAACRGKGSTLYVIGGHRGKERAHGDVEHRINLDVCPRCFFVFILSIVVSLGFT